MSNLARKTLIVRRHLLLLSLLLLAASCGSAFAPVELSERDYAVLSDFLRSQLKRANGVNDIRVGAKGSVVAPLTMPFLTPLEKERRDWPLRGFKGVKSDTIESFKQCAEKQMVVRHRFDLTVEYKVALPEETKDIEALYAAYPRTIGYVQFSCVGVNSSGTQALFFLERLMTRYGVGKWILMERVPPSDWVIKHEFVRWIS